jgi:hypothetical protein
MAGDEPAAVLVISEERAFILWMSACHTKPFVQPGIVIVHAATEPTPVETERVECCDYCGSGNLEWRKCKLVCTDCRQINKSCADL